jgi:glutamate/aspartate transport system substrate-binding protein
MTKSTQIAKLVAGIFAGAILSAPVIAQDLTGTMKKIKETGTITIGHRESSIPFSYLDDKQQPIGYSMDLCNKVVDAVKKELKMPNLAVKLQPVTSSNRIPLMQNGTIDLECGSTTNSVERQKQVAFGNTTFVVQLTAAVKKSSNINSLADLNGKTISTTSGTTMVPQLKKQKRTEGIEVKEIYGKDHAESFLLLADDRVTAFMMDDILLAGQIANSKAPGDYKIINETLRTEPYAVMLRKDDPQFKKVVDTTLAGMMKSGEIEKIYAKWFTSAIPPKNINLNFAMTPALKAAFAAPNDKGVE